MKRDLLFAKEMGKRIAQRRKELGLTQEKAAERCGLSLQFFASVETGGKVRARKPGQAGRGLGGSARTNCCWGVSPTLTGTGSPMPETAQRGGIPAPNDRDGTVFLGPGPAAKGRIRKPLCGAFFIVGRPALAHGTRRGWPGPAGRRWGTSAPPWRRTGCAAALPAPCGAAGGRKAPRPSTRSPRPRRGHTWRSRS